MHLRKAVEWFLEGLAGPLKMATDAAVGHVLHPRATTEPYCRFPPLILCLSTHVDHVPPEDQNEIPPRQLSSTVGLSEPTPVNERPLSDDYPGSDDICPDLMISPRHTWPRHLMQLLSPASGPRRAAYGYIDSINPSAAASPLLSPPLLALNVSRLAPHCSLPSSPMPSSNPPQPRDVAIRLPPLFVCSFGTNTGWTARAAGPRYTRQMLRRDGYFWNVPCPGRQTVG
ncbi:hypothetical protein BT67DRAFT_7402 [Trichocladium antarcticum]|uniref:Uncharacterized protein n=1 Tax=Trichocladium antarcticum TaxID=1450529 RepID=A0AAN6UTH8_9PEZI|nr:hypothetical protein BT67DRAFT_7402 [Trichocladium antarcticum]